MPVVPSRNRGQLNKVGILHANPLLLKSNSSPKELDIWSIQKQVFFSIWYSTDTLTAN